MQKRSPPNHMATKRPLEHSLLFPETKARLSPTAAPPESGTVCRMNAAVLLSQFVRGGIMSKFERLLEAGSTELPDCRCTAEMHPILTKTISESVEKVRASGGSTAH